MHLVVHDYSGHPGQVNLARALATRGHTVIHQHCPSYPSGRGGVERRPDDPPGFAVETVRMFSSFARYSPAKRVLQELQYGVLAGRAIARQKPDAVLLSNVPLIAHFAVAIRLFAKRIPMVFWHQDVYSVGIAAGARRLGPLGRPIGWIADQLEAWIARRSCAIIAISPSFLAPYERWRIDPAKIEVIPNWAALPDVPVRCRDNAFAREHRLVPGPTLIYTGTLGYKHDPSALLRLAEQVGADFEHGRVLVVSQGLGREWIEEQLAAHPLPNLLLLDYQPYRLLPDILASADVLVVLLESGASAYSVPSKALTYLCAGRALLCVMPVDNDVARLVTGAGAGVVVEPGEPAALALAVKALLADDAGRARMGAAARAYAEEHFRVDEIAERFEARLGGW